MSTAGNHDKPADERLTELEIKAGFTDDLLEELNRTIYRQQQQIEQLRGELRALRQQMQMAAPSEQRSAADEVPPHY